MHQKLARQHFIVW